MKTNVFIRVKLEKDHYLVLILDAGEQSVMTVAPFAKSLAGATLNLATDGIQWGEITTAIVSRSDAPIPNTLHLNGPGATEKAIELGEKMTLGEAMEAGASSMENGTMFRLGMKSFTLLFQIQFNATA